MTTHWKLAARASAMNPSIIREILKVTEKPGIISFAGGLPSPKTFPITEFAAACAKVLANDGQAALQYAASEGFPALREWVAKSLPWAVDPDQVLITTGSQQALDLIAKILIDKDSRVLVETPTYLGALQAFTPMEPQFVSVASDAQFPKPDRAHHERSAPGSLEHRRPRARPADCGRQPLRRFVV
jgi:2-aminoadipate transaminase